MGGRVGDAVKVRNDNGRRKVRVIRKGEIDKR